MGNIFTFQQYKICWQEALLLHSRSASNTNFRTLFDTFVLKIQN